MKREEIEAAVEWYEKECRSRSWFKHARTLAEWAVAERQKRERDQQPPTREMFERLDISDYCGTLEWDRDHRLPRFYAGGWFVEVPTVVKLRAACLLLGISTDGVL